MNKVWLGFMLGVIFMGTLFGSAFTFIPEYTTMYKQGVKDALANNVKGKVVCEMVIHDRRTEK